MLPACRHYINTGRINAAMSQNVRQSGYVLFHTVKCTCEQLSQIVWEYFCRAYPGSVAEPFHCRPDIASVYSVPFACPENHSLSYAVSGGKIQQLAAQL